MNGKTPTQLGPLELTLITAPALSMEPYRGIVSLFSPEDGNKSRFRNVMFSSYLELRTIGKVQNPRNSELFHILRRKLVPT
jgi:hypothetical protein